MQDVQKQIDEAKKSEFPPIEDLWNNIYLDPLVGLAILADKPAQPMCSEWTYVF